MNIQKMYELKCSTPSDINEHLPILKLYAEQCNHITEFGVRQPTSTYAFLASKAEVVISYDIETQPEVLECMEFCKSHKREWRFIEADVLKVEIEETDFLLIDTFHTYAQLSAELRLHSSRVRKYIAMHDTTTYGITGEQPYLKQGHSGMNDGKGLLEAINEFLIDNPQWLISYKTNRNNGLVILQKK